MIIKLPACYDVSHWKEITDCTKVTPKPLLFITKATEATAFVDSKFVRFFAGMAQIGVRRGCFHFHRKAYKAADQAAHFCNTIQGRITDDDILILDVEEGGETAAQLKAWFEAVRAQFPRNQLMLYSRKNILDPIQMLMGLLPSAVSKPLERLVYGENPLNAIQMTLAEREFFREIPTWTAGYPANPDLYASVPSFYVPDQSKFGPCWLWQYSDKGTVEGIEGDVDLNWIDPVFAAMLEDGGTVPPGGGTMQYIEGTALGSVKIRQTPSTDGAEYSPPRYLVKGDVIKASEVVNDRWLHLTEINGAPAEGWSSAGASQGYISWKWVTVPEVPGVADMPFVITLGGGGSPYVETVVTGVVKAK